MNQLENQIHFEKFKKNQFATIEDQLNCYRLTVEHYMDTKQYKELWSFISECSESVIASEYVQEVLEFYLKLLPEVQSRCPENLDVLYTFIGHCYFINANAEEARTYYYLACSYAMEYKKFQVLSLTLNNLNALEINTTPKDISLEKSKYTPVFFKMKNSDASLGLQIRMIGHIEAALELDRTDYALMLYNRYFSESPFEKNSRPAIQCELLKALIVMKQESYEQALLIFHEHLILCVQSKSHQDLIIEMYKYISECYEKLGWTMHMEAYNHEKDTMKKQLFYQLPTAKKMQHYLHPYTYGDEYFTHDVHSFEQLADDYCKNLDQSGHSLIVIDMEMKEEFADRLEELVQFIHEQMQATFKESILLSTRKDYTRLCYIVPMSEAECDRLGALVHERVKLYNTPEKIYQTIFFASINNVEQGLQGYYQCLNYAHALIYYELYK